MQQDPFANESQNVEEQNQRVQELPALQELLGNASRLQEILAATEEWAHRTATPEFIQNLTLGLRYFQERVSPQFLRICAEFDRWTISAEVMSQAGWLPHYTTPFQDVAKSRDDIEGVKQILLDYYQDDWQSVRSQIENQLSHCDVDDMAKEAMREALDSHEAGHYRSVCALLCSEIERVIRVGIPSISDRQVKAEKLVQGLVDEKGPPEALLPWGLCELTILGYLTKGVIKRDEFSSDDFIHGLYEHVTGPSDLRRLQDSEIPNRHAVLHGLVVYSSMQSSLNAIFLADYIFRVVTDSKS